MLFTHANWDHVLGFPFFKPVYLKGTCITLYGSPITHQSMKKTWHLRSSYCYYDIFHTLNQNLGTLQGSYC